MAAVEILFPQIYGGNMWVVGLALSGLAVGIGVAAALVAYALVWLIAVITNLAYYQRFSSHFVSPAGNQLGGWAVLVPVIGGLVIGLMARYGSEKIRGHGIPEALEAILIGRSRVEPKVALLKPVSSVLSIQPHSVFISQTTQAPVVRRTSSVAISSARSAPRGPSS